MSGLSNVERVGCANILNLLPEVDLRSLCDTVTNKMIVVEDITEAKDTILVFTKNAEELLKRKKVHRDLIFKYLAKEGVVMSPTSEKHQLVKKALELWSSRKAVVDVKVQPETDDTRPDSTNVKAEVGVDAQALGQQFCRWFFQLLNSQNLSLGQQPENWGPQHFWPNVRLRLLTRTGSEQIEEFEGAEMVNLRLLAMASEERLFFSPNLESHGLKVLVSPHGLLLVAVAGTIHRDGSCLGIFEQIFGLISSPLQDNNWKIKFVNLKIRGQDALSGTEVVAPALSYNSTDLQLLCS
ncbi:uncharacterized protein C3orf38 homolog [Antennarius striatus]|uniref:uncharacterized protein C3orf38 homolog n=1 Tax=Antennarius striatus TaxID=241820 RepID=UPI0035B0A75C